MAVSKKMPAKKAVATVGKKRDHLFKKGQPKTAGRVKGTPNKKTVVINNIITLMTQQLGDGVGKDLKKISAKGRVDTLLGLLEYQFPKKARVDESGEAVTDVKVVIERTRKA